MEPTFNALTAEDVAKMLDVSKNTVYALAKDGRLSSYNVGRKLRFTLEDVQAYIAASRPAAGGPASVANAATATPVAGSPAPWAPPAVGMGNRLARTPGAFLIGGEDALTDNIATALTEAGIFTARSYQNSYQALTDMYFGLLDAAVINLWDSSTDKFNLPYVKRLLPGVPLRVYHLATYSQGLLVQKGNPLGLRSWADVARSGAVLANREAGSSSRILLDEHLRLLEADPRTIPGYSREVPTALMQGSLIARKDADAGIGTERIFHQIKGLDYLPLQNTQLALVVAKRPATERTLRPLRTLLKGDAFKQSLSPMAGYNFTLLGEAIYEV